MNKQDKLEEQEYIDLYNKGYGIYQFSPEMAELFISTKSQSPKFEALKAGAEKARNENEPSHFPNWLKRDRFKVDNRNVGKSKGRDIEPDKN